MQMLRSGKGLFRRGGRGEPKSQIIYSAIPTGRFNEFHPCITITRGGDEETLILNDNIIGWLPAVEAAKQMAAQLEAHERAT